MIHIIIRFCSFYCFLESNVAGWVMNTEWLIMYSLFRQYMVFIMRSLQF